MKHTFLLLTLLFSVACSSDGEKKEMIQVERTVVTEDVNSSVEDTGWESEQDLRDILPDDIYLNGILTLPPQNYASVTLIMGGTIHSTQLMPGAFVRKGAVLAQLENIDFVNLQQTYLEAAAQTEYLEQEYNRQRNLSEKEAASKKRFQESKAEYLSMKSRKEAAAAQLRMLDIDAGELLKNGIQSYLPIKAPITGYVTGVKLNVGKHFQSGESICEIVDKGQVMLNLTAYEKDLPFLAAGEEIRFTVNGIKGKEFSATVLLIGQEVDMASRSLDVYAKVDGTHDLFRPGMYVTARVNKK